MGLVPEGGEGLLDRLDSLDPAKNDIFNILIISNLLEPLPLDLICLRRFPWPAISNHSVFLRIFVKLIPRLEPDPTDLGH